MTTFLSDPDERGYVACGWDVCSGSRWTVTRAQRWRRTNCSQGGDCSSNGWPRREPVVWLIDDVQYADAGLLEFVDHLLDWARDLPIVVLVGTRPELKRPPGWAAGRNRTGLKLEPLDGGRWTTSSMHSFPACQCRARTAIAEHAQGVPLFAVETIRSLVDRDVVQPLARPLPTRRRRRDAQRPRRIARPACGAAGRVRTERARAGRGRRGARNIVPGRRGSGDLRPGRRGPSAPDSLNSSVAKCSRSRPTRCRQSGARTSSRRTSCDRWPTTPFPAGTVRPGTSPSPRTCGPASPTTAMRSSTSSPGTTVTHWRRSRTTPTPGRSGRRRSRRWPAAAQRALRSGCAPRRVGQLRRSRRA